MDIHCNRDLFISQNSFSDSKIHNLSLLDCGLKSLPATGTIGKVKIPNLGINRITHMFSSYVSLEALFLIANGITYVGPRAFIGTKLTYLFLDHNKLICVPDLGAISSTLQFVDISHNHLHKFKIETQAKTLPELKMLFLKNNRLTILPRICYRSPRLAYLEINDNNFTTLNDFRNV